MQRLGQTRAIGGSAKTTATGAFGESPLAPVVVFDYCGDMETKETETITNTTDHWGTPLTTVGGIGHIYTCTDEDDGRTFYNVNMQAARAGVKFGASAWRNKKLSEMKKRQAKKFSAPEPKPATIRISRKFAAEIRRAVIAKIGERRTCEVGERLSTKGDISMNALHWEDQATNDPNFWDLNDVHRLHEISERDIETVDGVVELDIYCYYMRDHAYALDLDQNISVFVKDGEILKVCTTEELIAAERERDAK